MCISELTEVSTRLEQAYNAFSETDDLQEMYNRYEMLAIQILDSEFDNFPDKALEYYLMGYLQATKYSLLGDDAFLFNPG
jgi:hypothetical protein